MEIQIKLIAKSFLFIDDFALKKTEGIVPLDLSNKSDAFIRTIAASVACGIVESDFTQEEILGLIKDDEMKYNASKFLGVEAQVPEVLDVMDAPVEILEAEIETEEVAEEETEEEETVPSEDELPQELNIPESTLKELLVGTTKSVSRKIGNAELSEDDKKALYALEEEGRNRATIKSLLS